MRIQFKNIYLASILAGLIVVGLDIALLGGTRWFVAVIILAVNVGWAHFWYDFYQELQRQKEIELKFLEFIRSLVGSVRSGLPISKAILQVSREDFGAMSPYVHKLANQIEWGIPLHNALLIMASDTQNGVIHRSISIIIEADKSGGDIGDVLESVSQSVYNVKRLKQNLKSETHSQVVQGYIVFYIFIGVMLMIQLYLTPQLSGLNANLAPGETMDLNVLPGGIGTGSPGEVVDLDRIFFFLVIIQGFFSGLTIGKFSEGTIKQGLVHSLILIVTATLIVTLVKGGI